MWNSPRLLIIAFSLLAFGVELSSPAGAQERTLTMLFLINRRYPVLAAVLGFISNIAFLLIGITTGHKAIIIMSAAWTALSIAQITVRGRRHLSPGRP